jgi:hypothetical protein
MLNGRVQSMYGHYYGSTNGGGLPNDIRDRRSTKESINPSNRKSPTVPLHWAARVCRNLVWLGIGCFTSKSGINPILLKSEILSPQHLKSIFVDGYLWGGMCSKEPKNKTRDRKTKT